MRYPFLVFDWGDTLMKDDPGRQTAMFTWPRVEAVAGASTILRRVHLGGRTVCLATNAAQSDEGMIRRALQRVEIDRWVDFVFCRQNTGLGKPDPAFYRFILERLRAAPSQALMIGDSFPNDVEAANRAGVFALWFNPKTSEDRRSEMHDTIHSLAGLLDFLEAR